MSTTSRKRQPAGQRAGGQFAPETSGRAGISSRSSAPVAFPHLPAPTNLAAIANPAERVAAIEAEREALQAAIRPVEERIKTLWHALQDARSEQANMIEEVTQEKLRELFELSWSGGVGNEAAMKRVNEYMQSLGVPARVASLLGGRHVPATDDELEAISWSGLYYQSPQIVLDWDDSDADLDVWAAGYAAYAAKVSEATGVQQVRYDILDSSAGQYNSYSVVYAPATQVATVVGRRWHGEVATGTMREMLAYVRKNAPLRTKPGSSFDDDDPGW